VTQIEYPDVNAPIAPTVLQSPSPLSIQNPSELQTFDLTLQDAIRAALQSSEVFRSLGGTIVAAPAGQATQRDPALTELNPLSGNRSRTRGIRRPSDITVVLAKEQSAYQQCGQPILGKRISANDRKLHQCY